MAARPWLPAGAAAVALRRSCSSGSLPRDQGGEGRRRLGGDVGRLLEERAAERQREAAQALQAAAMAAAQAAARVEMLEAVAQARSALAHARDLHQQGEEEDVVEVLIEWLDQKKQWLDTPDMHTVHQAMVALGCRACNLAATQHLQARQVARAFGYTRTCERWLALRMRDTGSEPGSDMWLRLEFDLNFNSAELAKSSGDLVRAASLLQTCERLQGKLPHTSVPEAVHLCLAEVLQQIGQPAQAAVQAGRAVRILQQQWSVGTPKLFSLVFALSLEQVTLASVGSDLPPPPRAFDCLADAETAAYQGLSPELESVQPLLAKMRQVHQELTCRWQRTRSTYAQLVAGSRSCDWSTASQRQSCKEKPRVWSAPCRRSSSMPTRPRSGSCGLPGLKSKRPER